MELDLNIAMNDIVKISEPDNFCRFELSFNVKVNNDIVENIASRAEAKLGFPRVEIIEL
jgi:hypothetical protein